MFINDIEWPQRHWLCKNTVISYHSQIISCTIHLLAWRVTDGYITGTQWTWPINTCPDCSYDIVCLHNTKTIVFITCADRNVYICVIITQIPSHLIQYRDACWLETTWSHLHTTFSPHELHWPVWNRILSCENMIQWSNILITQFFPQPST